MDALVASLVVVSVVALVAIGAVVWLLVQRGKESVLVAQADAQARAAEERRGAAEGQLEHTRTQLHEAERRVEQALQDVARLNERLAGLIEAREQDQREAARALEDAIGTERRVHREQLDAATRVHAEKLSSVEQARQEIADKLREFDTKMQQAFGKLAADALSKSSGQFLELAAERLGAVKAEAGATIAERAKAVETLVMPIAEALKRTDEKLAAIEKERGSAYAALTQQVRAMQEQGAALRVETGRLVKALREPQVRGRYGEVQLRRVAELAGMRSYCDFDEQNQTTAEDGRALRPDMVVRLPNERELVVDAKANLKPYIDAMEAENPKDAEQCLQQFADGVVDQAEKLARKGYYGEYAGSPEFVVMFLPGDGFLDAALARRPDLLETAASKNVILASPASLIALLRAVAMGFTEQRLAAEAGALRELGAKLHERVQIALSYAVALGKSLNTSVEKYNEFIASAERNLLSTARRFEERGAKSTKELQGDDAMGPVVVRAQLPTKAAAMLPFRDVDER